MLKFLPETVGVNFPMWVKTTSCKTITRKVAIVTRWGIIWEYATYKVVSE